MGPTTVAPPNVACVGPVGQCTYQALQDALDDPSLDRIELLGGTHTGNFIVPAGFKPLTIVGFWGATLEPLVPRNFVLTSTGRGLVLRDLVIDGRDMAPQLRLFTRSHHLERITLRDGAVVGMVGACLDVNAIELVVLDSQIERCRGTGPGFATVALHEGVIELNGLRLFDNDGPALLVDGSQTTVSDLAVADTRGRGLLATAMDTLTVHRGWFCNNSDVAFEAVQGCIDDCSFEHLVFSGNTASLPGTMRFIGPVGSVTVSRATFVGNTGLVEGIHSTNGAVSVDHALFVGTGPQVTGTNQRPLLTESAAFRTDGVRELGTERLDAPPRFIPGEIPPACGVSVVLAPDAPENAILTAWPEPAGIGALTTPGCGPWCLDDDRDGTPKMWDCDDQDEEVAHHPGCLPCPIDADGDGYGVAGSYVSSETCASDAILGDCDDDAPSVHPGALEVPGNGIDDDCDGTELCFADADDDGYAGTLVAIAGRDCDEAGFVGADGGDCDDNDGRVTVPCRLRLSGGRCATGGPPGSPWAWLSLWALWRRVSRSREGSSCGR